MQALLHSCASRVVLRIRNYSRGIASTHAALKPILNPKSYSPLRDGYLKHQGNLGLKNPALVEKRRRVYADCVKQHLPGSKAEDGGKDGKAKSRK